MHIYCSIPKNKHFYVVRGRERSEKHPKSDWLEWYQKWQVIRRNQTFLVSIDRWKALMRICQIWSWVVHPVRKKNELQKKYDFFQSLSFFKWRGLKIENLELFGNVNFWPPLLLLKKLLNFSESKWTTHRQITGSTMQCIFIDWYPETGIFMLYAAVNVPRSPQKATNWSDIKNGKSFKEIRIP
jgi:hypothetical protein